MAHLRLWLYAVAISPGTTLVWHTDLESELLVVATWFVLVMVQEGPLHAELALK